MKFVSFLGVLIGLDIDLLLVLVHRQLACWQQRTGSFAGCEHQIDGADAVVPQACFGVLSEDEVAICDETEFCARSRSARTSTQWAIMRNVNILVEQFLRKTIERPS